MKKVKRDRRMIAIAPVAEYRGVAIVEMAGNKRAVWQGIEYKTEGHPWFIFRVGMAARFHQRFPPSRPVPNQTTSRPAHLDFMALPNERQAKSCLDGIAEEGENPATFFLSCQEIMTLLGGPRRMPLTRWDEAQGLFVE